MRFHLLMLLIVVLVSLGMHGLATAEPVEATGAAPGLGRAGPETLACPWPGNGWPAALAPGAWGRAG